MRAPSSKSSRQKAAKPSTFIGSSSEALGIARQVQHDLQDVTRAKLWTQGVFGLGWNNIESLLNEFESHDFAILVLSPDDVVRSRGKELKSPRDNVVFELGLFMSRLGPKRTFVLYDSADAPKLLSDLEGLTLAGYDGEWAKADLQAAVGAACQPIRLAIQRLGRLNRTQDFQNWSGLGRWRASSDSLELDCTLTLADAVYLWSPAPLRVGNSVTFDLEFTNAIVDVATYDFRIALFGKSRTDAYLSEHLLLLAPWEGDPVEEFRVDEMTPNGPVLQSKRPTDLHFEAGRKYRYDLAIGVRDVSITIDGNRILRHACDVASRLEDGPYWGISSHLGRFRISNMLVR